MRDIKAYQEQGRNNPHSPEQMEEHPYDFVSLPERPAKGVAVPHNATPADRWSGTLRLAYHLEMPLHVGSGVFETAEECGLRGGSKPVRGISRSMGRPILGGSGWKGAVRARFEAITASRLALRPRTQQEWELQVPQALHQGQHRKYRFDLADPKVQAAEPLRIARSLQDLESASPADVLFGCMGYRGRVLPGEGTIEGPAAEDPLRVAALDSPMSHRLAKPGGLSHVHSSTYQITEVEGRKFYYDGDLVSHRTLVGAGGPREVYEWIDYVPAGSTIRLDVGLASLTETEVGALLISAGLGNDVGILRFGGYKSAGLGKVRLESVDAQLHQGRATRRWKRAPGTGLDLDGAVAAARQSLVDATLLQELHTVTTLRRPAS